MEDFAISNRDELFARMDEIKVDDNFISPEGGVASIEEDYHNQNLLQYIV